MLTVSKSEHSEFAVTLAEVKTWLAIDHSGYDDMLENIIIPAAQDMIERSTGLCLTDCDIVETWAAFPGVINLSYMPCDTDSVEVTTGGEDVTDSYLLEADTLVGDPIAAETIIGYTAGYESMPAGLKVIVLELVATIFNDRTTTEIPAAIRNKLLIYTRNLAI